MSGVPTGSQEARERCAGGAGAAGARGAPIPTTSTAATCAGDSPGTAEHPLS